MGEKTFTIGRDPSCDVPVADDSVSRIHAQISFTNEDLIFITDRRSSNGTFVIRDGRREPLSQDFVSPEDSLQFGDAVLRVEDLLAAIRRKHQKVRTSHLRAPSPEPPGDVSRGLPGARLVRCSCGEVKRQGKPCPMCGT